MKLATFSAQDIRAPRVAGLMALNGISYLADVTAAYAVYLSTVEGDPAAAEVAAARVPNDTLKLIQGGEHALAAARQGLRFAAEACAGVAERARWERVGILHRTDEIDFLPPIAKPGKIICIGMNYYSHVDEVSTKRSVERRSFPVAFAKFPSVLTGHGQPIVYPRHTACLDYEGELGVIIGKRCKDVRAEDYLDVVAGFTIFNDVSLRDTQMLEMKAGMILMGKNSDSSAPLGPYLVTKDEVVDPQNLRIAVSVNGEQRQNDTTANMIFSVGEIIAHFSRMTLEPGDIFATGTPSGVGFFRADAERYLLKAGDVVEIEIEPLGVLRNQVVSEDEHRRALQDVPERRLSMPRY